MLEQNKNPISPLVAGQLPDFVKIDHPTLNSFLSAYYEWLDKDTTYLRSPKRLNEVIDIDTTMDEFVAKFKNEFLFDFPETLAELDDGTTVDASKLVKNIKSFYKAKGTEKTYDFLFRILYDTGVEFYYPKKDILKLSHGKWILKKTIKLSNFLGSTIFDSIGETVKQRNSQGEITASGRVIDATTYRVGIYEIAELSLGGINGTFDVAKGEVEFVDNYGNVRKENRIFPVIGEVTITTAGSGYLLGDRVVLTPAAGDTGLNALGRVSEISSTGGVKKVMMYNLGVNYKVPPTISIISELGKDFSGTVSVSAQANYAGYYANSDGKLGSNKVIQDNHYYQDFSYVMLAEITIDRYRDVIKKLLNPAGMAFFGKILLKRCAAAELNQSTALAQYEVPLIGNYLPYTFITYEDLSKWFVKTITVNGKVQTTIDGYNRNMQESVIRNDYTKDGIVDGQDYEQWLSMHPQDTSTEKQFIQKIGNPFASQNVNPGTDGNPLLRQGSTEHPFWIVYQHPNRKVADTVVARIPYDLKNDFLSNHGALALTGSENFPWNYPMPVWNPSATGVSGVLGFAASAEEPEAVPTGLVVGWGRNTSLNGFSGNNQCFGTNSDGTEIYEKAGTEFCPLMQLSARRTGTTGTGMYGDPVKILGSRLENVTKVMTVGSYGIYSGGVTIALKDSSIIAWGNSDTPIMSIPVSARSGVSDFHAQTRGTYDQGQIHAIKTDGRVFSWGNNEYGECGGIDVAGKQIISPSSTGQYLKMGASDLTGVVQIENTKQTNGQRIYALLNTGKVVTWGGGTWMQRILGTSSTGSNIVCNKTVTVCSSPYVSVMGNTLTDAIQIATGYYHAIALKSNGTVVALDAYSVVPTGLTGVASIVACQTTSAAVLSDGTIRIWGGVHSGGIWPTGTDYTGNDIAGPTIDPTDNIGWTGNSPYKIWGETLTGISALIAPKTTQEGGDVLYLYAKKQDGRLIPIWQAWSSIPSAFNFGYDKFANYSKSAAAAGSGASGNTAGNLFDWYQSGGDLFPFDGRFTKASSCNGGLTSISCCGTVCVGIKDGLDSFPDITSITGTTSGPFAGGTQFTVNGTAFQSDSIVKIDGVTAASATINSPTSITVTTPTAKTSGTKVVSVENACGFAGMTAAFTYQGKAEVTNVSPYYGLMAGGTTITISGTNLTGATSVIIGGVAATNVAVVSATQITAVTAARGAGICDVVVTCAAGTLTYPKGFTYIHPTLTITAIGPTSGPSTGGTSIKITGTNFYDVASVNFLTTPATNFVVSSPTSITVVSPPSSSLGACPISVRTETDVVKTTIGKNASIQGWKYTSPQVVVSSINVNSGPTTGETLVTITGDNFINAFRGDEFIDYVRIGNSNLRNLVIVSNTQITGKTSVSSPGLKDLVVHYWNITTSGWAESILTNAFTYTAVAPTITSITPNIGSDMGGQLVTIIGTNFTGNIKDGYGCDMIGQMEVGLTASFTSGTDLILSDFDVVSSTKIVGRTRHLTSEIIGSITGGSLTVGVKIINCGGQATLNAGYTYVKQAEPPIQINPNVGPTGGGTTIEITNLNSLVSGYRAPVPYVGGSQPYGVVSIGSYVTDVTTVVSEFPIAKVPVLMDMHSDNDGGKIILTNYGFITSDYRGYEMTTIPEEIRDGNEISSVVAGNYGYAAIKNGRVYIFSRQDRSQYTAPIKIPTEAQTNDVEQIHGGENNWIIKKTNGSVFVWGDNQYGQCNIPTNLSAVSKVYSSVNTSLAVLADGTVRVWGYAGLGQAGNDGGENYYYNQTAPYSGCWNGETPLKIGGQILTNVKELFIGQQGFWFAAKKFDNSIVTWGHTDTVKSINLPDAPSGTHYLNLGMNFLENGIPFAVGLLSNGKVVIHGVNDGRNGTGAATSEVHNIPIEASGNDIVAAYASGRRVFAVKNTGDIINWGDDGRITASPNLGLPKYVKKLITTTVPKAVTPWPVGAKDVLITFGAFGGQRKFLAGGFTFQSTGSTSPTISRITPKTGPIAGGTSINIVGTNFTGTTSITIGGVAVTSFSVVGAISILAVTPAGIAGPQDVVVTNPSGSGTSVGGFTYIGAALTTPTITSITPPTGPIAGGTPTVIKGTFLSGPTGQFSTVFFDGLTATVSSNTSTAISCVSPAHALGGVNVSVVAQGGTATSLGGFYYYDSNPLIDADGVFPNKGPTAGGTNITIKGTNLTGTTSVTIDGVAATSVNVVSPAKITAITPAGTLGLKNLQVVTPIGTATQSGAFTYIGQQSTATSVVSVIPNFGPIIGGTRICIQGTGLTGTTGVTVDGNSATELSYTKVEAQSDGLVLSWGYNSIDGQYGICLGTDKDGNAIAEPSRTYGTVATKLMGDDLISVSALAAGYSHSIALKAGAVLAWGDNSKGQCTIPASAQSGVSAIAGGFYHTIALKNGAVLAWGQNSEGQCTVPAPALSGVTAIAGGAYHTVALKAGAVLAWGNNDYGQCTIPTSASSGVSAIASGNNHSLAVKNGGVIAWGWNAYGQCNVPASAQTGVVGVAAGANFSIALKDNGTLVGWGNNTRGNCLGTDTKGNDIKTLIESGQTPVQIDGVILTGVSTILAGAEHCMALVGDKVVMWGSYTHSVPASAENGVGAIATSLNSGHDFHLYAKNSGGAGSETLCCKTPAGTVGAKDVVVTAAGGTITSSNAFTYVSSSPTIDPYGSGVLPNSGPTVGGTAIKITGTNLTGTTSVTVDGVATTSVVVVSSTKVTAVTPAGTLGAKDVAVTTPNGSVTANNAFTYIDPAPVINSSGNGVIPNKGPTTGGTPITILGNYFNGANKVTVGGKSATNVVVVSGSIITAVTPSGSQGIKDVSVTTASGTGTLRNAFTYYLPIYSGPIHIEGAWPEWNESVTANREYWTREFTEGDRYVSLSYNPLVPLYQDTPGSDGATGLSVYKNTTSTVYGNPTNLYDSFVVDGTDWSKEQIEALGPSFVGGKRCYKFTETELNLPTNRTTESIVNSLETWLYSQGFNRTTQQYVILKLNQENTLEMIQVLRGIKRLFPEAKFGYYDYPKIPSFVLVTEQQYNSFEYLSDASRNTIIENTTNSIYDLIKEQDLIVLDMHFSSPSLAKMKVLAAAKIKVADRLNQKLVAEGLRRKVVIVATSRIWKTNSNETPIWVRSNEPEIAQSTRDQYYIPEYSVVKPSTFIDTFKDIIGTVAGESRFTGNGYRTIDGYYNDLDPQFLLQAALGSTHTDYVNSIYNDVPPVLNANRSINTDSYQTLVRKSLSTYVNYSKGVTGSTEFYSATGATANSWHYDYWFPLVNKKISSIPSLYYPEIKTTILYNAIYPIYYKFNYLISMAYSAAGQAVGGFNLSGNLLSSWPTSDADSPEVATVLGDLDGSGQIDSADLAVILLNWGDDSTLNPEYRYDAPWTNTDGEVILPTNKLLGYKIAYSDFRKITARSFFEMPVGREFNCTTDQVTAPPVPVVFAAKINGSAYPLQANYDHTDASNLVTGGENLVLHLEAERGITGTPTEGISSLVYLGYYGIRSLWAELYAVKPSEAGNAEIEYQIANAGPFKPTSSIISINTPFPNFENPNTTNEMFTANYRISDSSSFLFGGANIVKNNFFMRLKLVFRNGSNSAVPNATKVMDFNYNRT